MRNYLLIFSFILCSLNSTARPIEVVVHRGANALAPENTIASCDSALAHGASWIEVDVRPSKDGVLFNLHDETLDRTTSGKGLLKDMLSEDVKKLDAGSWYSPKFKNTPLPTIKDMLLHVKGKAKVFFDVKRGTPVESLIQLVRETGYSKKSFFWMGDEAMLRKFVALAPDLKIKVNANGIERLKYWQTVCKPAYVEIAPHDITPEFSTYCHKNGILVMAACQEDDTSQFQMVVDKHADLVNLDRPEVFEKVVKASSYVLTSAQLKLKGDGKTINTSAIQQAIDKISKRGGGTLRFSKGCYLTGSLVLKRNVTLRLDKDAILFGSSNPADYHQLNIDASGNDTRSDNASMALIIAHQSNDVRIIGEGTIDGNGTQLALNIDSLIHKGLLKDEHYNIRRNRPSELVRPKLFFFSECNDVTIQNVHCKSSANWGLSFDRCKNLTLQNLDIENRAYWNNDGIDVTDCENVLIAGCKINSADDGICLKSYHTDACNKDILIRDCDIRSSASAVKFGTASWGGFQDIHIKNIKVRDTFRSAIAIESVDGAYINNVKVENIHAENTGNAIFMRLGQRAGNQKGSISNVLIKDLYCEIPLGRPDQNYDLRGPEVDFFHNSFPSSICGIPENTIKNVRIENVKIVAPGGSSRAMAYIPLWRAAEVPEKINASPEFSMFGELPSWGFYLRHIDGIAFKNVSLQLKGEEFRPAFVLEDVKNESFEDMNLPADAQLSNIYIR